MKNISSYWPMGPMSLEQWRRFIRRLACCILNLDIERQLEIEQAQAKARFAFICEHAVEYFKDLMVLDTGDLIEPFWQEMHGKLAKNFYPVLSWDFLRNDTIRKLMFNDSGGSVLQKQISFLEDAFGSQLPNLLAEDIVGRPLIMNRKYRTSHSRVHHLYHIARWLQNTHQSIKDLCHVVEWGGGYGNMARLFKRLNPNITYSIIDLTLFSYIQYIYLGSILGEDSISLATMQTSTTAKNRINLIPLKNNAMMGVLPNIHADLFVSTWALSESSTSSMEFVKSNRFFGADHLLIAFTGKNDAQLPNNQFIKSILPGDVGYSPLDLLPGNTYAFC